MVYTVFCYRSLSPTSTDRAQLARVCLNLERWGSNSGNNFAIFPFDINPERLLIIIRRFSFSFDVCNRQRSVISITCHQLLLESRQRGLSRTVKAIAEGSMLSPIHLAQAYVSVRDTDRRLSRPVVAASIRERESRAAAHFGTARPVTEGLLLSDSTQYASHDSLTEDAKESSSCHWCLFFLKRRYSMSRTLVRKRKAFSTKTLVLAEIK